MDRGAAIYDFDRRDAGGKRESGGRITGAGGDNRRPEPHAPAVAINVGDLQPRGLVRGGGTFSSLY
ncbi:MAG: hypothetical protein WBW33_25580 [Bryobacteraceae bacterium]